MALGNSLPGFEAGKEVYPSLAENSGYGKPPKGGKGAIIGNLTFSPFYGIEKAGLVKEASSHDVFDSR